MVDEEVLGTGVGRSKKAAEQKAAEAAWNLLTERATVVQDAEAEQAAAEQSAAEQSATESGPLARDSVEPETTT